MVNPQTLRILRITRGLTQKALAKIIKKTRQRVGEWEAGIHQPSQASQELLAKAFDCEIATLHAEIPIEFHDEMVETLRARFFALVESDDRGDVREALRIARYIYPKPIYVSGITEVSDAQKQLEDDLTDEVPEGWEDDTGLDES